MIKELMIENKPTRNKFIGFHRINEATAPPNLMVAKPTRTERRYKVTLVIKVSGHKMWWQSNLTADDRHQAIEMGKKLFRNDLLRTKSIGFKLEFIEALLVDKTQSQNKTPSRG